MYLKKKKEILELDNKQKQKAKLKSTTFLS